jgi:hypothetical protein
MARKPSAISLLQLVGRPFIALFAMSGYRATSATAPAHLHPTQTAHHPERSRRTPSPSTSPTPSTPFSHQPQPNLEAPQPSSGPPRNPRTGAASAVPPPRAKRAPLCRRPERSRRRSDQLALFRTTHPSQPHHAKPLAVRAGHALHSPKSTRHPRAKAHVSPQPGSSAASGSSPSSSPTSLSASAASSLPTSRTPKSP